MCVGGDFLWHEKRKEKQASKEGREGGTEGGKELETYKAGQTEPSIQLLYIAFSQKLSSSIGDDLRVRTVQC